MNIAQLVILIQIQKFIALLDDLQVNNIHQMSDSTDQENVILENFKNQLILAKENIKQELINGAINANKNANNAHTFKVMVDLFRIFFGNK